VYKQKGESNSSSKKPSDENSMDIQYTKEGYFADDAHVLILYIKRTVEQIQQCETIRRTGPQSRTET